MKYRAKIINKVTGESRWYLCEYDDDDDVHDFSVWHWTEGNYGCDCNRALFFARAAGEPDLDVECGEVLFAVPFLEFEDGRKVNIDPPSPRLDS